jgi:hypothetical protein
MFKKEKVLIFSPLMGEGGEGIRGKNFWQTLYFYERNLVSVVQASGLCRTAAPGCPPFMEPHPLACTVIPQ